MTQEHNREVVFSRRDGWFSAWIGEELLMMSAENSAYLSLSGSGGRIWELLEEPRSLMELCDALAAEYDVEPGQVRAEVETFLERLQRQRAVQLHPAAVA